MSAAGSGSWRDRVVGLLRRRVFRTRPSDVVAVVEALEAAGLQCLLAGGWGVDALIGEQTRRHHDLDVTTGRLAGRLAPTVRPHLPIHPEATEVVLMARDRFGSWAARERFPLGGGSPR